jgi:cytoskeletal protein CcmA (bactofilin family)
MARWRFRSKDSVDGTDIVGFIGEGTTFTGNLVLKGGARIDGKIVGRLEAASLLVIGPNGDIEVEELRAKRVVVCGSVRGNLVVEERLEIQPGGRVSGRVVMASEGLVIAPGAIFEGIVEYVRAETEEAGSRELAVEALAG